MGHYRGVCPDIKVGGVDNFQMNLFKRENSLTSITFRRNLQNSGDEGDYVIDKSKPTYIVWAIGKLSNTKEPGFHHIYPKHDKALVFGRKSQNNCFQFTTPRKKIFETNGASQTGASGISQVSSLVTRSWGPLRLLNRTMTTFYARIGDSGGLRGYYGSTGQAAPNLVWYINGLLAPVLYVKRGRTYTFRVEGGNNPSLAEVYNPLYITSDPHGGYTEQTDTERRKHHVYSGIEFDRRGRPSPTSAGRLCAWTIKGNRSSEQRYFDKRRADTNRYATFIQYRNALHYSCENGNAALMQWTPNASTPDIVYYQSYTHRNMGNKIIVLDDFITSYASLVDVTSSHSATEGLCYVSALQLITACISLAISLSVL